MFAVRYVRSVGRSIFLGEAKVNDVYDMLTVGAAASN